VQVQQKAERLGCYKSNFTGENIVESHFYVLPASKESQFYLPIDTLYLGGSLFEQALKQTSRISECLFPSAFGIVKHNLIGLEIFRIKIHF